MLARTKIDKRNRQTVWVVFENNNMQAQLTDHLVCQQEQNIWTQLTDPNATSKPNASTIHELEKMCTRCAQGGLGVELSC